MTTLLLGDSLERLKEIEAESVDAVVTDPPYGLSKEPDIAEVMKHWIAGDKYTHKHNGFMGKSWDSFVPGPEYWREVYRVMKPGAHLLCFAGTRTVDLMAVSIRFAGFEIRDLCMWLHGQGFPKSKNLGAGFGSALKPAVEPIVMARKPCEGTLEKNFAKHGTGAINVDASRIGTTGGETHSGGFGSGIYGDSKGVKTDLTPKGRWPANVLFDEWDEQVLTLQDSIPETAKVAIEEYYAGYCKLSGLRSQNGHFPESERPQEVLQSGVLRDGSFDATGADAGQAPQRKDDGQNSENEKGQARQLFRQEQLPLEGRMALAGLSLHSSGDAPAKETGDCRANDKEGARASGTSPSDGPQAETPAQGVRSGTSQKRDKVRQSPEQSRTTRHESPQERTLASVERGATTPLLVRQSDVPQMWTRYFKDSGFTVRAGAAAMLDEQSGVSSARGGHPKVHTGTTNSAGNCYGDFGAKENKVVRNDSGGASRFFYVAKASKRERNAGLEGMPERECASKQQNSAGRMENGELTNTRPPEPKSANHHPTVKPIKLMEYLVRMITPPGGVVLDPFMGSGTTGCAAVRLGFEFIGIERESEYLEIALKRIAHALAKSDEQLPLEGA